jgi:hypothetical protein
MSTLCVVTCGRRKIWDDNPDAGAARAENAYTGPFHRACQQYAHTFHPGAWCILSAKYGFLFPSDVVSENYDVSFTRPATHSISCGELQHQAMDKGLTDHDRVVVLGGRLYRDKARQVFGAGKVDAPLEGLRGIGVMMRALNEAIRHREPL